MVLLFFKINDFYLIPHQPNVIFLIHIIKWEISVYGNEDPYRNLDYDEGIVLQVRDKWFRYVSDLTEVNIFIVLLYLFIYLKGMFNYLRLYSYFIDFAGFGINFPQQILPDMDQGNDGRKFYLENSLFNHPLY